MDMINGPAGGNFAARMRGTKVQIAGQTIYLPNSDVPLVQKLTLAQINAIPKDQFSVSFIEPSMPLMSRSGTRKGRTNLSFHRQQRFRMGGTNGVIGYINKTPPNVARIEIGGTKCYDIIITKLKEAIVETSTAKLSHREALRNQKDDPLPNSDIFFELIDENELSDCILKIIERYFGTGDTCKILGKEYKLGEFCVLMHFYFIRIGILDNQTRKPFCNYLQKKVFDGEERFSVRSFNNYTNEYDSLKGDFTHADWLKIDFGTRPDPSGKPLQDAFHEIGFAFHNSHYFRKLKKQQERMMKLLL